jgi:hypothetical protein
MYKYSRIVFLVETPFTIRDEERFGIKEYISNGFIVEVYDVQKVFNKKMYNTSQDSIINADYIKYINKKTELKNLLSVNSSDTVLILIAYQYIALINILNTIEIDYILIYTNSIPNITWEKQNKISKKIKIIFNKIIDRNIINKIYQTLFYRLEALILKFILNPKYILAGGKESISFLPEKLISKAKIIWVHTLDYDLYLKSNDSQKQNSFVDIFGNRYNEEELKDAIVFLDEYSPYHPDNEFQNIPYSDKPETYYPTIERFFNFLETSLNKKVVIAAHPRSEYRDKNHFKSFPIIKNRTIDLVNLSSLNLLHSSTSINFVNLLNKPMIFFYTSSMTMKYKLYTEVFAKWHSSKAIEIGSSTYFDSIEFPTFVSDKKNYKSYKESFIKIGFSKEKFSWEIIIDEFLKL